MNIRELDVFTIRIERERLGKDAESTIAIFVLMEEHGLSCQCVARNIDWLSITMDGIYLQKTVSFMQQLSERLPGVNLTLTKDIRLLAMEDDIFTARRIGYVLSSLEMQGIDIMMSRQIKGNRKWVLGFRREQFDEAKSIVAGELEASQGGTL